MPRWGKPDASWFSIEQLRKQGSEHVGRLMHFNADGGLECRNGGSWRAGGAAPHAPEQFERLQRQIHKMKKSASPAGGATEEAITGLSAEGLFPGLGDHHLDRYIAAIRNFTTHAVSDPRIAI